MIKGQIQEAVKQLIITEMRKKKITRAELARRLNTSRGAVTLMFDDQRWTLDRMEQTAAAIGIELKVTVNRRRRKTYVPEEGLEMCKKCGQKDDGQTGEYPCSECGLPTTHDEVKEQTK